MKIAILSDIHGNIVALEAVLKDLEAQGNVDHILMPGDMFAYGPAPQEVLAALQELTNVHFLRGNTDRYLLEVSYPTTSSRGEWQDKLLRSFCWTAERLGDAGLGFIERLSRFQVVQAGGRKLLAVHGSPRSDEEGLDIKTGEEALQAMPISPEVAVVACGHTHIPMDHFVGDVHLVNAGSVGLPFDGDPRACYAIVSNLATNSTGPTQVELRRVVYDVEKVVEQCYACNHPAADIHAYNLRSARSIGNGPIYTREMRQNNGLPEESLIGNTRQGCCIRAIQSLN
jgi:putative phosphoesterase